jgi:indolepyruvate ferredoxin oxidoreductase, alpha subunit
MPLKRKKLLSGNEAIALGAYEAGVTVATGYPGTPATEILESLTSYDGVYAEWSVNEKVALEVASGASIAGARTLCAMKHVGLNVAADPLMTLSYTGVGGGLVIVSADDPGHHSSQNEQDNRNYAAFSKIPMLEPSDSDEARAFTKLAFELSERFDTPVLLRTTTRVSHSKSVVSHGRREKARPAKMPTPKPAKYVMIPGYSEARHDLAEERLEALRTFAEGFEHNTAEYGDNDIGVVTSGISYQYVKEALPEACVLKLGMSYPLPGGLVREFASKVRRLYVVEELDPFIETQVLSLGVKAAGKLTKPGFLPLAGELDPDAVKSAFGKAHAGAPAGMKGLPARPPSLCPGCPHRGVFYALKRRGYFVAGDIGCYTLAHSEPLSSVHTTLCMGAGIGQAHGIAKALEASGRGEKEPVAAVIGDSTFLHSGMTALLNTVYNKGAGVVVILDNRTTAMTGRQAHPGSGSTLGGEHAPAADVAQVARALGVRDVTVVDPYDIEQLDGLLAGGRKRPRVIVARRPCTLIERRRPARPYAVSDEDCTGCGACVETACPAISLRNGRAWIDPSLCAACAICAKVCPEGAIGK